MRYPLLTAALLAALPMHAGGSWNVDLHRAAPSLDGHYLGTQGGRPVAFDLAGDLGLGKGSTPLGLGLEYQGPRFALELAMEAQNYAGNNVIARDVTISGQTWHAQAAVASAFKVTTCTGNWTMRFLRTPGAWVGLDLGVRTTVLDLQASSQNYLSNTLANATFKSALPMPQVGPCLGWTGLDGRLAARASYHYLIYRGASYHHAAADVRYFPLPWLGVRAFAASEGWKLPNHSLASDLEVGLARRGAGFGVVARF